MSKEQENSAEEIETENATLAEKSQETESQEEEKTPDQIIEQLEQENEELRDKYLRIVAEFENFRKRQEKIFTEMLEQERNNVIGRLLDIADDVSRATSAAEENFDPQQILSGIKLIEQRISELLRLENVTAEDPTGQIFDPLQHEAMGIIPVDSEEQDGVVVQIVSPTYKRGSRLIRPAKVFVGKYVKDEEEMEGNS